MFDVATNFIAIILITRHEASWGMNYQPIDHEINFEEIKQLQIQKMIIFYRLMSMPLLGSTVFYLQVYSSISVCDYNLNLKKRNTNRLTEFTILDYSEDFAPHSHGRVSSLRDGSDRDGDTSYVAYPPSTAFRSKYVYNTHIQMRWFELMCQVQYFVSFYVFCFRIISLRTSAAAGRQRLPLCCAVITINKIEINQTKLTLCMCMLLRIAQWATNYTKPSGCSAQRI